MTFNRAFVSQLDVSADGTLTGKAMTQHSMPRATALVISGEIREEGGRRWVELKCNFIERGAQRASQKARTE